MSEEKAAPEEVSTEEPIEEQAEELSMQEQLNEMQGKNLMLLAEMENARKRMQKEKIDMNRFAVENVISEFLAPLDQLENALGFTDKMNEETRNWALGFNMILGQFKEVLSSHGIDPFHSEGEMFDPYKHEAIETEETHEYPEGHIIKEFVKGYQAGDRIVRAARVKVAKAPKEESTVEEENKEGE